MKTYLVTGAAGFIGANFIKYMLAKYEDIRIVVLDLLTYAGNLGTIAEDIDTSKGILATGRLPASFSRHTPSIMWSTSRPKAM